MSNEVAQPVEHESVRSSTVEEKTGYASKASSTSNRCKHLAPLSYLLAWNMLAFNALESIDGRRTEFAKLTYFPI
jgi:hypothetical protein